MRREVSRTGPGPVRPTRLPALVRASAGIGAVLSFALLFVSAVYSAGAFTEEAPPPLLGNQPETIAALDARRDDIRPFTFWVAGDEHDQNYLRMLYPEEIKPMHPSFGIILGDVVIDPVREQHRYFWREAGRWEIDSPVLMVVGNHDVSEAHPIKNPAAIPRSFDMRQFREAYGPADFSFTYAGCLFIILNDALGGDAYVRFLKGVLEKEAAGARMIFVVCHIPVYTRSTVLGYPSHDAPEFTDLVEKYRIDYVISAHYHGYLRKELSGTTYLISGGGIGLVGRESDRISHGILFDVEPETGTVSERIIVVHEGVAHFALHHLDYYAATVLSPFVQSHPFLKGCCYFFLILSVTILCIGSLWRTPKRSKGRPPKRGTGRMPRGT